MLNKMLYQVAALKPNFISISFHFISSHSIFLFLSFSPFFLSIHLFVRSLVGSFALVCCSSGRTFIHICDLLLYFIYFRFTCSLSRWNCCRLCFIVELDRVLVLVRSFLSSHFVFAALVHSLTHSLCVSVFLTFSACHESELQIKSRLSDLSNSFCNV